MADGWLSTLLGYHRLKDGLDALFPQRSTIKIVGATITDDEEAKQTVVEIGAGGFPRSKYTGYAKNNVTWDSTTWSDVHNKLTIFDVDTIGIARSNSDFTVTKGGDYIVDYRAMAHNTAGDDFIAVRLLRNGTEVAQFQAHANGSARTVVSQLHWPVTVADGDVLKLQYQVTAAFNNYVPVTADGEDGRNASIAIYRYS